MKVSVKWLNSYVKVDDIDVHELADRITNAGIEVEGIEPLTVATSVVSGEVIECAPHPDSDHLHVCKVDVGSEVLDIVCGAPNCRKGIKVLVALVGAQLKDGTIKASTIRGCASNGMLCSLLELGIEKNMLPLGSKSDTGIEELPLDTVNGNAHILDDLGLVDWILDVSPTPNRADCNAMWNFAKEVGAILNRDVTIPWIDGYANQGGPTKLRIYSTTANCPHFLGKIVNHVQLGPSPKWMSEQLHAAGVKSINNVVDISNYVMLETGQPLHFYDLRTNPDQEITVVDDYQGPYTALDGITYDLVKGDLVITSGGKAAGIAGVMGGDNTKIENDTTSILIEAALFDHAAIRHTSNRLGLQTEAASRFAKGLDPLAQRKAMDRAVELLVKYANGSDMEATVEYGNDQYTPNVVVETMEHLNGLLGTHIALESAVDVLKRLDFDPKVDGTTITCTIPSYRSDDVKLAADIDEEVIRMIGYDDLTNTLPLCENSFGSLNPSQKQRRMIRSYMTNHGLYEIISFTLVDDYGSTHGALPLGPRIAVASPLSEEHKYVRNSLMSSLLSTVAYNHAHFIKDVNLYEVSSVYGDHPLDQPLVYPMHYTDTNPWDQQERLGIVLSGEVETNPLVHHSLKADYYVMKGLIEGLLEQLGYDGKRIKLVENTIDTDHFHPYQSVTIQLNGQTIGIFGRVHPAMEAHYDIQDIYYGEIDLDALVNGHPNGIKVKTINKYPSTSRDLSIVVKEDVKTADLCASAKSAGGKLVSSVSVFDVYTGQHVEKGYKSVSLSIVYESFDHTLKDDEINPIQDKIVDTLVCAYHAVQR